MRDNKTSQNGRGPLVIDCCLKAGRPPSQTAAAPNPTDSSSSQPFIIRLLASSKELLLCLSKIGTTHTTASNLQEHFGVRTILCGTLSSDSANLQPPRRVVGKTVIL
ncbi:AAEL008503-PA [Aedes aegypti]|uniref:AAEL008503-PA n=1 Tax=Aedes aegypti TaxID=7159 RepID=Q16YL4_AEDAE|nr:AAEL008503-PA [Aedes aegypti]